MFLNGFLAIPQLYGKKLNRVPGTLFALHSDHDLPNGVRNTLSVTIRVKECAKDNNVKIKN